MLGYVSRNTLIDSRIDSFPWFYSSGKNEFINNKKGQPIKKTYKQRIYLQVAVYLHYEEQCQALSHQYYKYRRNKINTSYKKQEI